MRREQGFTLLEILAAFVIFGLIFATTLRVLSGSLRNAQRSSDYTQAALWAQTAIEGIGIEPLLEEGSYSGDFDNGYRWEMEIVPFELEASESIIDLTLPGEYPGDAAGRGDGGQDGSGDQLQGDGPELTSLPDQGDVPIDLYEVELQVFWGEPGAERAARFVTLRSITPQP
ncbi:MAG: type II secretion system protein [Pseudomonadota bacterium]